MPSSDAPRHPAPTIAPLRFAAAPSGRPGVLRRLASAIVLLAIVVGLFTGFAAAGVDHDAVRVQARGSAVAAHIPTWAFDDGCSGGLGASPALVRQWVTYAESNCGPGATKARTDCHAGGLTGCTVLQYLDTDWNFGVEAVHINRSSVSSWWLHEPAPHQRVRLFSDSFGGGHLVNQTNPAVRSFFRSYARRHYDADDGLLLDWQSPSLSQELYYSTCHCMTSREIRSDQVLRSAHEAMSAALTHTNGRPFLQIDNSLPPNPYLPQGLDMLNQRTGVVGWVVEGEPTDQGNLDPFYSTLLDQIAYVATRTHGFVAPMARATAGAAYQLRTRRVQEATMLLGFTPGHLVDWSNFETGSLDLAVWPEEGIYPTRPIETMQAPGGHGCLAGTGIVCSTGGHNSIQVAPGVYRREFRGCYRRQVPVGGCAALINTTAHAVTVKPMWLTGHYGHQITMVGGDVQSGGRVDLAGAPFAAGSTQVPAKDAILLAA